MWPPFPISLASTHSQNVSKYTVQVLHQLGFSTSLEDFRFSGHFKETFHVQSEIQAYHATQDIKEDFAELQWVKMDGGQEISCAIEDVETRGHGRPSKAKMMLFPHRYSPSLETMHSLVEKLPLHSIRSNQGRKLSDSDWYLGNRDSWGKYYFSRQDPPSASSNCHQ